MKRIRHARFIVLAVLLLLGVMAQAAPTYRRVDLGNEIFVPFPAPKAPNEDSADGYRSLKLLVASVTDTGNKDLITRVSGFSYVSTSGGGVPSFPIPFMKVESPVTDSGNLSVPVAVAPDERPDGSKKGRALITSGIHAREWMAFEAVVRALADFRSTDFEARIQDVRDNVRPGDRSCFFAENVDSFWLPLANPGGIFFSQAFPTSCYQINNRDPRWASATECQALAGGVDGPLRHGRFRTKNLAGVLIPAGFTSTALVDSDVHGKGKGHGPDSVTERDPTALLGITADTNVVAQLFKPAVIPDTLQAESTNYKGVDPSGLRSESEAQALYAAATTAFVDSSGTQSYTGAAALDVHTAGGVVFGMSDAKFQDAYSRKIASAAGLSSTLRPSGIDAVVQIEFAAPGAQLELPMDDLIARLDQRKPVNASLQFLVRPGPVYAAQRKLTRQAIDAALDWASGPPYVRQVIVLGENAPVTTSGVVDIGKTGDETQVFYWRRWDKRDADSRGVPETIGGTTVLVPTDLLPKVPARWVKGAADGGPATIHVVISFSKPVWTSDLTGRPPLTAMLSSSDAFGNRSTSVSTATPVGDPVWLNGKLMSKSADELTLGALRYEFDTLRLTMTIPREATAGLATFFLEMFDQSGLELDGGPSTVAKWKKGSFEKYDHQTIFDMGKGGTDNSHRGFKVDAKNPRLQRAGS